MARGDLASSSQKGSGRGFNKITKWVMRRSTGVPRGPDIPSPASATTAVSAIPTARPSVPTTAGSEDTPYHHSDDHIGLSKSVTVPPSRSEERPSVYCQHYASQPAPSLTPVSDIDGETAFFDAHTHPPTATEKSPQRIGVEKVHNRPSLKTKLSANQVKNFHDVVRRLKEMVPAGGINPAKHGDGREMYAKAMSLQEQVMKANKIPRT